MLKRILNRMLAMARGLDDEEPVEPTPEMIGEMWEAEGVPPARDPRATWYQQLSVEELWKELSASGSGNAALVTLKRPELHRGYFNGVVLISEEEIQEAQQQLLAIAGVAPWDGSPHEARMPIMPDERRYPAVVVQIRDAQAVNEIVSLPSVEAVEPLFVAMDGSGCSLPPYTPNPADGMWSQNLIPCSLSKSAPLHGRDDPAGGSSRRKGTS